MSRVFDEKFQATGYDETGWSETVDAGCTVDEDADVADVGSPSRWGDKCLKIAIDDDSEDAYTTNQSIGALSDSWFRMEVYWTNFNLVSSGQCHPLAMCWNASWGTVWTLWAQRYAGVIDAFILAVPGRANYSSHGFVTPAQDTLYRVEVKWDTSNDIWAWRINGVNCPNDQDSTDPVELEGTMPVGHAEEISKLRIGCFGVGGLTEKVGTYYIDNVAFDDADWVGAEQSVVPMTMHHHMKNIG